MFRKNSLPVYGLSLLLSAVMAFTPVYGYQAPAESETKEQAQPLPHDHVLAIVDRLEPELRELLVKDYLALFETASALPETTRAKLVSADATIRDTYHDFEVTHELGGRRMEREHELLTSELERLTKASRPSPNDVEKEWRRFSDAIERRAGAARSLERDMRTLETQLQTEKDGKKRRELADQILERRVSLEGTQNEIAVLERLRSSLRVHTADGWTAYQKEQGHDLRCRIQLLEKSMAEEKVNFTKLRMAYDHASAKIELLLEWPGDQRGIEARIAAGQAAEREFGDVENIGFRVLHGKGWKSSQKDQEKDLRLGREIYEKMKARNLIKEPVDDPEIQRYARAIADRIIASSDIKVPIVVQVLNDDEVNAFAFPGHFFVNKGLILALENESQLAGIMAHELAHNAARHVPRGNSAASKRSLIWQALYIALIIGTGGYGAIAYAAYYGLQFAQLLLIADILRISRGFEEEADLLGAQYAWKAGYDPKLSARKRRL